MKYFLKKLMGHEVSSSMASWATKFFFEKFVKPFAPPSPSYILNVRSLKEIFQMPSLCSIYLKRMTIVNAEYSYY